MILAVLFPGFYETQNLNNPIVDSLPDFVTSSTSLLEPVVVQPGEPIIDAQGELSVLALDVLYRPAGCLTTDCKQAYSGREPVQIDQWVLRFHMQAGLMWSDNEPVTASDSVYAYEIAKTLQPPRLVDLLERTAAYQALDGQTVEWRGLPGYTSPEVGSKFFTPLPRHAWGGIDPSNLAQDENVSRQPVSYGPFMVASWIPGERIKLVRNPNYYRAAEGLPYLDGLDFVFVPAGEAAEEALLSESGGCDVLDASAVLDTQAGRFAMLQAENKVKLVVQPAAWEALYFNIAPVDPEQAAIFSQPAVRQAAALCIDRAEISRQVFGGLAPIAAGLGAAQLAAGQPGEPQFDFEQGQALLEQAGWRDHDQDANTARISVGVLGVPDGTTLSLTYLVSEEPHRKIAATLASQGLITCGMAVDLRFLAPAEYLAPGPGGPVFGRNFAAAQFGWSIPGGLVPCSLFTSVSIPGQYPQSPQEWGGANASGYASAAFDQACTASDTSLPGAEQAAAWSLVEQIFAQDLPALPLYWRPRLYVLKPGTCGLVAGTAENNLVFSPESLNKGKDCQSRD